MVIVAGSPPGIPGSTNALRVHRIGDAKNRAVSAPAYRPEERSTALTRDRLDSRTGPLGPGGRHVACRRHDWRAPGRGGGMADTEDSKSSARKGVRVRVPLPAHE